MAFGANIGNFPAIHINPAELNALIVRHGSWAEYRKAVLCPCNRKETGMGSVGCKVCNGLGWAYPAELRQRCKFLDSSRTGQNRFEPSGHIVQGNLTVSIQAPLIPALGDVLMPCGERHIVHEQLHRALDQVDQREVRATADYGHRTRPSGPKAERLLYRDNVEVESLYWAVEPTGPDDDGLRRGRIGTDFRLVPEGAGTRIEWVGTRGPARGKGYGVRYTADAAYMVKASMPVLRREANQQMPYRAVLDRLDKRQEADLR
jgi:hypothetical protein